MEAAGLGRAVWICTPSREQRATAEGPVRRLRGPSHGGAVSGAGVGEPPRLRPSLACFGGRRERRAPARSDRGRLPGSRTPRRPRQPPRPHTVLALTEPLAGDSPAPRCGGTRKGRCSGMYLRRKACSFRVYVELLGKTLGVIFGAKEGAVLVTEFAALVAVNGASDELRLSQADWTPWTPVPDPCPRELGPDGHGGPANSPVCPVGR